MVDHLLKGTPDGIINRVQIRGIRWPYVSLQRIGRSHAARNAVRYYRNHSLDGATLFPKIDSNKLRFNVKNKMTLICAKFDADLINISKVTSRKTK